MAEIIRTKTVEDIFEFYTFWKLTSHYKLWKLHRSIINRHNYTSLV